MTKFESTFVRHGVSTNGVPMVVAYLDIEPPLGYIDELEPYEVMDRLASTVSAGYELRTDRSNGVYRDGNVVVAVRDGGITVGSAHELYGDRDQGAFDAVTSITNKVIDCVRAVRNEESEYPDYRIRS